MERKISPETYKGVANTEKLTKSSVTFANTLEFFVVFGKH